jgi:uncharacterized protein YfaS (alpha-2-macroglobulin family)
MILETLTLLDMKTKAALMAKEVSKALNSGYWMSTQTTAYCLIAVSKFAGTSASSSEMRYTATINNNSPISLNTKLPLKQIDMQLKGATAGKLSITNNGKGILFARVILEGIPETGDKTYASNDLKVNIKYTTMKGEEIDVTKLEQGTDFIAEAQISNPGTRGEYLQMALSQIFPSGYQYIRDDRVYTYFNISPFKTNTYRIVLNAAYIGKFYLPTIYCEAMYDNTINARKAGKWVEVVKAGE